MKTKEQKMKIAIEARQNRLDEAMLTVANLRHQLDNERKEVQRLEAENQRITLEFARLSAVERNKRIHLGFMLKKSFGEMYERERAKCVRALAQETALEESSRLITSIATAHTVITLCKIEVDAAIEASNKYGKFIEDYSEFTP